MMTTPDRLFSLVDDNADEVVALLTDLIRFETVNTGVMPTGNELPLCQYLQRRLAAEGIESQILLSAENRGNLIARLAGSQATARRLLYMGHTDVVPVEDPAEWRYPPFSGTVADGRVWGRGAADMKDMVAAEVMALILLRRAGVALKGDLILAAGADEETGGEYGFGWLAKNAPEAILADYAINESGGGPIPTPNGLVYTINTGEKGRLEVHITLARQGHPCGVSVDGRQPRLQTGGSASPPAGMAARDRRVGRALRAPACPVRPCRTARSRRSDHGPECGRPGR